MSHHRKEYDKQWRATHREQIRRTQKKYQESHKAERRQKENEYRKIHHEKIRQREIQYYATHKDHINERRRQFWKTHHEQVLQKQRKRTSSAQSKQYRKLKYHNQKIAVLNLLGGARCIYCDCNNVDALEINHVNGGGGKEWKKLGQPVMFAVLDGRRNTTDLEVVCRVCNAHHYMKLKGVTGWDIHWNAPLAIS